MANIRRRLVQWTNSPLRQGTLLLVLLITVFLHESLFSSQVLIVTDILFELDPLWKSLAPPGFITSQNGLLSDHFGLFYPWQAYARAAFENGQFALWNPPLWNPYVNSGHPFMGNLQSALYDPLHLLTFLVPFPQSIDFLAWLRLFVAGFFTLCLALELGLSRRAAYLAMIVFAFGMPQIVWLGYTKASVLAWLPALWFFSARVIRRGDWRDVGGLALVTVAQFMGGHPESSIYMEIAWGTFALYGLWFLWRRKRQPILRATLQLGVGGLLGVMLSAVQWLPLLETVQQSTALATRNEFALDWRSIFFQWHNWAGGITLVIPNFFGNPRLDTAWYPFDNFNEQIFFMGVTPLVLTLLVLFTGRLVAPRNPASQASTTSPEGSADFWWTPTLWGGPAAYFVGVAIIGTGIALSLPAFTLLAEAPGLHLVRPSRWRGLVMGAVALLAGYGLDRYLGMLAAKQTITKQIAKPSNGMAQAQSVPTQILRRWVWIWGVLGVSSALGTFLGWVVLDANRARLLAMARAQVPSLVASPAYPRTAEAYLAMAEARVDQLIASLHPTFWTTYLPLWIGLLVVGAQWWLLRRSTSAQRRSLIMGWLILLIVLLELWRVAYDYNPVQARRDVMPTPPMIEELRRYDAAHTPDEADPFRVVGMNWTMSPNTNMVLGLEDVRGYEPSGSHRYDEVMKQVNGQHESIFTHGQHPILDFLNVRYALSDVPLDATWELVAEEEAVALYFNREAMPRAFMVHTVRPVTTPEESLALMADADIDLRQEVILEGADAAEAETLAALEPPATPSRTTITHYAPDAITLDVETDAEGILVLSTSYLNGWQATLDGAPAPIYVANHAFHAIRVPAGTHTIAFTYAPMSFTIGAWVSGITLLPVLALLLWPRRRRRASLATTRAEAYASAD